MLGAITKSWAGLASLLFLFLLIAQFIAYFNYSATWPQVAAVKLGDLLERAEHRRRLAADRLHPRHDDRRPDHPAAIAKWAILAPIFIPLLHPARTSRRRPCSPPTASATRRSNVITPLMAYFPLIVVFAQRYQKDAGIGTVVSLMLPYVVDPVGRLDAVLRRLVPDRDPARPGLAGAHLMHADGAARDERQHDHASSCSARVVVAVRLGPLPGRDRRASASRSRCGRPACSTSTQALAGFGDPTVLFIASLFVVSEALDATGVTAWAGQQLVAPRGREPHAADRAARCCWSPLLTALISVNGAVAALLPVVVVMAVRLRPLAVAAAAAARVRARTPARCSR